MKEFALILRHPDGSRVASKEQITEWMNQTRDWIAGAGAKTEYVRGTGLLFDNSRVVINQKGVKTVLDRPFGDSSATAGGIIIIRSESLEEAVRFAGNCPVLQGEGNSVEVREISA